MLMSVLTSVQLNIYPEELNNRGSRTDARNHAHAAFCHQRSQWHPCHESSVLKQIEANRQ